MLRENAMDHIVTIIRGLEKFRERNTSRRFPAPEAGQQVVKLCRNRPLPRGIGEDDWLVHGNLNLCSTRSSILRSRITRPYYHKSCSLISNDRP